MIDFWESEANNNFTVFFGIILATGDYVMFKYGYFIWLIVTLISVISFGASCPPLDFEELPLDTAVTNQYTGVTFSVQPQSCVGSPKLYMRVKEPTSGGTSSGDNALIIDTGCPDFSSDYLRMDFQQLQRSVSFFLGAIDGGSGIAYNVRSYDSNYTLLSSVIYVSTTGVNKLVTVDSDDGTFKIKRIEVESTIGYWEAIDDLVYEMPVNVIIDSPTFLETVCEEVDIYGIACYGSGEDKLEYLKCTDPPGTDWTLVKEYHNPVCSSGLLYTWDTTGLDHGYYYVKVTATNSCGYSASNTVTVFVDKLFNTVEIQYPQHKSIKGGNALCIYGTAWDNHSFDEYTVDYSEDGSTWMPVDAGSPSYSSSKINERLATWDTTSLADGIYQIKVTGVDECGNAEDETYKIIIDNTVPVVDISNPSPCDTIIGPVTVKGIAYDDNISRWVLQYTGGPYDGWVTLASGTSSVWKDTLAVIDTSGWDPCCYTLRLRVWDQAQLNCMSDDYNYNEYLVSFKVGYIADINNDGRVDMADFRYLAEQWLLGT